MSLTRGQVNAVRIRLSEHMEFVAAFPPGTAMAVEAPCDGFADRPIVERGRLCGEATRAFPDSIYGNPASA
jgi:hypothetical protein